MGRTLLTILLLGGCGESGLPAGPPPFFTRPADGGGDSDQTDDQRRLLLPHVPLCGPLHTGWCCFDGCQPPSIIDGQPYTCNLGTPAPGTDTVLPCVDFLAGYYVADCALCPR